MKRFATGALCALFLLAGCGNDPGVDIASIPVQPRSADLQFVNLVSDSPEIFFLVGTVQQVLQFGEASLFDQLVTGEYELSAGYRDAAGEQVLIIDAEPVVLEDRDLITYYLTGTLANPVLQSQAFVDPQFDTSLTGTTVEVWFVNASSDAEEIDVYLTAPTLPIAAAVPLTQLGSGQTSEVFNVGTADNNFRLRVTRRGSFEVIFDSDGFTLIPPTRLMFALTDYFGPLPTPESDLLTASAIASGGQIPLAQLDIPAQLRIINLVRDIDALDVYFGSTSQAPFAADLNPLEVTGYKQIPDEVLPLNLTLSGVRDQFLVQRNLFYQGGQFHSMLLSPGPATGDRVSVTNFTTDRRRVGNRVTGTFLNTATDNSVVNLHMLTPGQTVDEVPPTVSGFTGSFQAFSARPGATDVLVTTGAGGTSLFGPERIIFRDDVIYTLVLIEDPFLEGSVADLIILEDETR